MDIREKELKKIIEKLGDENITKEQAVYLEQQRDYLIKQLDKGE